MLSIGGQDLLLGQHLGMTIMVQMPCRIRQGFVYFLKWDARAFFIEFPSFRASWCKPAGDSSSPERPARRVSVSELLGCQRTADCFSSEAMRA